MGISCVVLTRNEAKNIRGCLGAVSWCDEVLVVDSYSEDGTADLAAAAGARVLQHRFEDYASQRSFAIAQARCEWILMLDADERITPELRAEILDWTSRPETPYRAFDIPHLDFMFGRWIRHGGWFPQYHVRLFRKEDAAAVGAVHERVRVGGRVGRLRHPILHFSHVTPAHFLHKLNLYTSIEAQQRFERGERARWTHLVLRPPAYFAYRFLWRRGFRDGLHGFVLAVLMAVYQFVLEAKLAMLQFEHAAGHPTDAVLRQYEAAARDIEAGPGCVMRTEPVSWPPVEAATPITAVVVNWCSLAETRACVDGLLSLGWPGLRAVIVDNGSPDASGAALENAYQDEMRVTVIRNVQNLGFAAGVNVGFRAAARYQPEFVLLLNPDARIEAGALVLMVDLARRDGTVGAVGPTIAYAARPECVWHGGGWFSLWKTGVVVPDKNRLVAEVVGRPPEEVGFLTGCVLLLRRKALEEAGGFDEGFFLYEEDLDLSMRLRQRGYRLLYVPGAVAYHGITPEERYTGTVLYHRARSRLLLLRKHFLLGYAAYGLLMHVTAYSFWTLARLVAYRKDVRLFGAWWRGTLAGLRDAAGSPDVRDPDGVPG